MFGLLIFFACAFLLVGGYVVYGRIAERVYGCAPDLPMPCTTHADGVDYVQMPTWKVFLIQLLNIAGLGPVFGALSGCLFGAAALLWIVIGCIFAGAMHDFLAAVMSAEHEGSSLPDLIGRYLGRGAKHALRVICVLLLLLVGVVFTKGPAGMLHAMVSSVSLTGWCVIILGYYLLATILPINTIIGKLYPIFGALFIFMAVGLAISLPISGFEVLPQLDFSANTHPHGLPVWPMIFVTIACGAISGFHATQSPMMVRCLGQARLMRPVFYGAMITEGIVALIWATIGLSLRDVVTDYILTNGTPTLAEGAESARVTFLQLTLSNPAMAVNQACISLLGNFGAVLAVLGVVVLPITSGDTAMRSCRLILAEATGLAQRNIAKRLALALPIFSIVLAIIISQIDFSMLWRYFGWANQALACFTLWSISVCLRRKGRWHWISTLPAVFMTCMCATYLLYAPECLIALPMHISTAIGCVLALLCLCLLLRRQNRPL